LFVRNKAVAIVEKRKLLIFLPVCRMYSPKKLKSVWGCGEHRKHAAKKPPIDTLFAPSSGTKAPILINELIIHSQRKQMELA
jgi:hypothetical protein